MNSCQHKYNQGIWSRIMDIKDAARCWGLHKTTETTHFLLYR